MTDAPSPDVMPIVVGLTGGIASGKSTVSEMFRDLGALVIDADVIAREVVAPGTPGLDAIREAFGDGVIDDDGQLDRAALADIVFEDDTARATLEGITHPRIGERMIERALEAGGAGHAWVLYDAALLVENHIHEMLAALIVVAVDADTQLERLMARDLSSREDAQRRVDAQLPLANKVAVADYVIDNSGDRDATRAQVGSIHSTIAALVSEHGVARRPEADPDDAEEPS